MSTDPTPEPRVSLYRAVCLVAAIWFAVAVMATVVFAVFVPRLPSPMTVVIPGMGRAGRTGTNLISPSALLTICVVVSAVFAVVVVVAWLLESPRRLGVAIGALVFSVLVTIGVETVLVSAVFQLDASAAAHIMATDPIADVVVTLGYVALVVVLASGLFLARRLAYGRWLALSRRSS